MKTFRGRPEDEDYIDSDDGGDIDLDDPESLNDGYLDRFLIEPGEEIDLDELDLDERNQLFQAIAAQEDDTVSIDNESEGSLLDADADSDFSVDGFVVEEVNDSNENSPKAAEKECEREIEVKSGVIITPIDENSMESLELAISEANKIPDVGHGVTSSKDFLVSNDSSANSAESTNNGEMKGEGDVPVGSAANSSPHSSRVDSDPASVPASEDGDGADDSFCNPMASDTEGDGDDEALRGDRIGSTTYSERHVLKILMDWMKSLSELGKQSRATEVDDEGHDSEMVDKPLEPELEESMSLLWDMSAEKDVMTFLLDNSILLLIRDNLDSVDSPSRLKEIGLGILANLLSSPDILESFPEKDADVDLFERVMFEAVNGTKVPVLIQAFAVLRRIMCYVRNSKPVDRWMTAFLHEGFIKAANFLLTSSTNAILLGDVITLYFTLMEVLYPLGSDEPASEGPPPPVEDNFKPIVQSEYVASLCEALSELMKHLTSKNIAQLVMPPTDPYRLPQCDTSEMKPLEDVDIPNGLVQTSVLNGLSSLCYLLKLDSGKDQLRQNNQTIINVLLPVLQKFNVCVDRVHKPEILDHYASTMDLLNYCHSHLSRALPTAIGIPAYTTVWLIQNEKNTHDVSDNLDSETQTHVVTLRNGKTVETDVSPYILIYCNYIMDMEDRFGSAEIDAVIDKAANKKLKVFHESAKSKALKLQNSV